jgi:hypothetical protein
MAAHRAFFWRHVAAEAAEEAEGVASAEEANSGGVTGPPRAAAAAAATAATAAVVASRERLARLVDGADFVWAARDAAQTDNVMRAFGFYFDAYGRRAPWFMVFEVAAAVLSAALEELQERVGCLWSAWLVILVVLVYAAAMLVLRPHRVKLDRWIYTALALYQAGCGIAVGVTQVLPQDSSERDAAEGAAQWLLSVSAVLTMFAAGYEVFKVVYMQLVIHWRKLEAQRSRGEAAASEQMQPLLLLDTNGADAPLDAVGTTATAEHPFSGPAHSQPVPASRKQHLFSEQEDVDDDGLDELLGREGGEACDDLADLFDEAPTTEAEILSRRRVMHDTLKDALGGAAGAVDMDAAFREDAVPNPSDHKRHSGGAESPLSPLDSRHKRTLSEISF